MDRRSDRLRQLRESLKQNDQDGILVTKPENQVWLTDLRADNCFLVITQESALLLTDSRYTEAAENRVQGLYEVVLLRSGEGVSDFLRRSGIGKLVLELTDMTAAFYLELQESLPNMEFADGDGMIEALRAVKDPEELEQIRRAEELGDRCFTHMLDFLKPGKTESECAFEIEMFLRSRGASALSFPTICIFGTKTSLPHGEPGNQILKNGDLVTMDFGCVVDGYCSDMTRTVAVGSVTAEQRQVYDVVLAAQLAACEFLKAGVPCVEGDRAARSIIEEAGYGEFFGHGLGHGVGLEIHEAPTLNTRSSEILKKNMTVTIEPGIYLPGKFGIRIEDLAFVTDSGIIIASHSPKELIVL